MLNPQALKLVEEMKKEADAVFKKHDPTMSAKLAGMAVSDGGNEKMIDFLDLQFREFMEASEKLPQEFTLNFSPEIVFSALTKAQFYIFADQFRPTGGVALLPAARARKKEYNDTMDKRALMVAMEIQRCRMLLKL